MIKQREKRSDAEVELRLLSLVTLLRKVREGITNEELYKDAERKFDTLIDVLKGVYSEDSIFETVEFSPDELKQGVMLIFNRLISARNPDPYKTLCVLNDASPGEIKRRRNILLQIFHPDKDWENIASDMKTKLINEAYENILAQYGKGAIRIKRPVKDMPFYYNYKKRSYKSRRIYIFIAAAFILAFLGFLKMLFL